MNENEITGIERLEEAFRRHDRLYLEKYPPIPRGISKRLLTAFLAAVLLVCGAVGISAAKEPLRDFAFDICQGFVELFFGEKSPVPNETEYTLSVLPEGYTLCSEYRGENEYKRIWANENGDIILLLQLPLDAKTTLDTENSAQKTLDIGGTTAICFEKHDKRIFYWYSESYVFTLTVPASLSEEEGLALIRSLRAEI